MLSDDVDSAGCPAVKSRCDSIQFLKSLSNILESWLMLILDRIVDVSINVIERCHNWHALADVFHLTIHDCYFSK